MNGGQRDSADLTHITLSILFLGLLITATFWVLSPFLTSILWAVIVCVTVWPMLLRLETRFGGRRWPAVTIVTVLLLMTVFVPVTLAVLTIVDHAQQAASEIRHYQTIPLPGPPNWVRELPVAGDRVAAEWARIAALSGDERSAELAPYAQSALAWFALKAGGVGTVLLQFLLTAIISTIVLARGEVVREEILRFATRLGGQHGRDVAILAANTIRGVVAGVVLTALMQAAIAGTGLVIAGVPAAGLLTAAILFLCLAQIGPMPVLIPVVIWLYWSEQTSRASLLLVIAVVSGLLDNIVRPILIRRGAQLPLVLIFTGVIGGLIAFGIVGLFIGPVVLTVAYTLLKAWVAEADEVRA